MIDAKSLRLGNWILDRGIPTQVSMLSIGVTFYSINGVNLDKGTGRVLKFDAEGKAVVTGEDRFHGIFLTPEIMEGCGFTNPKSMHSHLYVDKDDFICIDLKKSVLYLNAVPTKIPPPKFLHELMNLHLDLTKQELSYHPSTISEKTG